jgi:hypothetical protein
MARNFTELSSFGTLVRYGLALEETAAELATAAAGRAGDDAARFAALAKKHTKRAQQIERLARERMNEVVLQPIEGMEREDYLPPVELSADAAADAATLAAAEDAMARFYADAARIAANVLTSLERPFKKLGKESADLGASLG